MNIVSELNIKDGFMTWVPLKDFNDIDNAFECDSCGSTKVFNLGDKQKPCNCRNGLVITEDMSRSVGEFTILSNDSHWGGNYRQLLLKCSCGELKSISKYISYDHKCSCGKKVLLDKPNKINKHVGRVIGDYTILAVTKDEVFVRCKSGTEKTYPKINMTRFKTNRCTCDMCQPDFGYSRKEYSNIWLRIRNDCEWLNYPDFELYMVAHSSEHEAKLNLMKLDKSLPYSAENSYFGESFKLDNSVWEARLPLAEGIKFIKSANKKFHFTCGSGHSFTRASNMYARGYREGFVLECDICNAEQRAYLNSLKSPKRITYTLHEKVSNKIPSISLIGDHSTPEEIGVFECSCCNTSYKLLIKDLLYKQVCPICKSESWAEKCDQRIKDKFDGRIVRTGTWINGNTPTSWKCNKHNTHFSKTYDKILSSVSGGCPDCINFTVPDPNAPTRRYYVRLRYDNTFFYKIGITQNTVENRFDREISKSKLKILEEWWHPTWEDAYEAEQEIIKAFKSELLCKGEKPLRKTGNTEIFYYDVLELDI